MMRIIRLCRPLRLYSNFGCLDAGDNVRRISQPANGLSVKTVESIDGWVTQAGGEDKTDARSRYPSPSLLQQCRFRGEEDAEVHLFKSYAVRES
jgi:hypothetical protein